MCEKIEERCYNIFFMVATSSPKRIVTASGDMYDGSFKEQGKKTKKYTKYGYMSLAVA